MFQFNAVKGSFQEQ